MSAFAEWQPRYAERGVATFPVVMAGDAKRPAVRGYLDMGADLSRQLVMRFPEADALGFALGSRSRVTVLDVDTNDERVLADALDKFGKTPIVVRSGSGNFQAWFRHAGEGRKIRPFAKEPIDVLGGGFVVAPPSKAARGSYQFLSGGLDDLDNLPALAGLPSDIIVPGPGSPRAGVKSDEGRRNDGLWRMCMQRAPSCSDLNEMLDFARESNARLLPPLPDDEAMRAARSAWKYTTEGRNFIGGRKVIPVLHDEVDGLMRRSPDAFILLTILRRHHWGRDFKIANAMAETMPGGGWPRKRLAAARALLETEGHVALVRAAGYRDAPTFRLTDGVVDFDHQ